MALLTPTSNPSVLLTTTSNFSILTNLTPALAHALYFAAVFRRILGSTTLFVAFRAYLLSLVLLRQSFYASQLILLQSYYATVLLSKQLFAAGKQIVRMAWKSTEAIRRKLFFEFMVFLLGSGYGLLLVVLWPGWLFIGGGACIAWIICS